MNSIPKRGDVREDGRIFVKTIRQNGRVYDYWAKPAAYENIVNRNRENAAKWRRNNPEKAKAAAEKSKEKRSMRGRSGEYAKMSQASKDKAKIRQSIWQKNNREKCVAATMRHRDSHKAACDEYRRKYCKIHRDRLNQQTRLFRKMNPGRQRAWGALKKAKARMAVDNEINSTIVSVIYQAVDRIQKCTGITHDVDHIIPISKGGTHHQANLQILTRKLNMKKSNKITNSSLYFPAFNDINNN